MRSQPVLLNTVQKQNDVTVMLSCYYFDRWSHQCHYWSGTVMLRAPSLCQLTVWSKLRLVLAITANTDGAEFIKKLSIYISYNTAKINNYSIYLYCSLMCKIFWEIPQLFQCNGLQESEPVCVLARLQTLALSKIKNIQKKQKTKTKRVYNKFANC